MADETTHVTEKVYCYDHPSAYQNNNALLGAVMSSNKNQCDPMAMMAMANGGYNNQWNNPMMYLVWMWMMRWMNNGWGENGYGSGMSLANSEALNFNNRQLSELRATVDNNHNADLTMQAIQGNGAAIHELANTFNTDFNTMSQAICSVKSAIENVAGQVGYSAEKVINAVNMGDSNIISAIQTTSCATQKAILEQGYQSQLANERQTNILGGQISSFQSANQLGQFQMQSALGNQINDTRNAMVSGFSQLGYANQQQTCDIVNAINASQQKTADLLTSHWQAETSQSLQDAKFEVSQLKQNQYLAGLISNNNCCGGCN